MQCLCERQEAFIHSTITGSFDSSRGDYRSCEVTDGAGGRSYMNYLKIPAKVEEFSLIVNERLQLVASLREQYELSFNTNTKVN